MEISFLGHSSFKLKGKSVTVVTDPYGVTAGKYPKDVIADIVTVSHDHEDHNAAENVRGEAFKVQYPGEFEIKGVSIIGIPSWHDEKNGEERGKNIVYVIEIDGLRIAHLGDLGDKLTAEQLEEMGAIDILLVPVGGKYTIDAKKALEVVKQVDPWVAIPMHYQDEGLDTKMFGELTGVGEFLKIMDKPNIEPMSKYIVSSDRLPSEFTLIWLQKK